MKPSPDCSFESFRPHQEQRNRARKYILWIHPNRIQLGTENTLEIALHNRSCRYNSYSTSIFPQAHSNLIHRKLSCPQSKCFRQTRVEHCLQTQKLKNRSPIKKYFFSLQIAPKLNGFFTPLSKRCASTRSHIETLHRDADSDWIQFDTDSRSLHRLPWSQSATR